MTRYTQTTLTAVAALLVHAQASAVTTLTFGSGAASLDLLPNTPGQSVDLFLSATPSQLTGGANLVLAVAPGGPAVEYTSLLTDTLYTGGALLPDTDTSPQGLNIGLLSPLPVTTAINATGTQKLGTLTFDTTGVSSGTYGLDFTGTSLLDQSGGPIGFTQLGGASVSVPEPPRSVIANLFEDYTEAGAVNNVTQFTENGWSFSDGTSPLRFDNHLVQGFGAANPNRTGYAGNEVIFGLVELDDFPLVSADALFDGVAAPPAGELMFHPGTDTDVVIIWTADQDYDGVILDYDITRPVDGNLASLAVDGTSGADLAETLYNNGGLNGELVVGSVAAGQTIVITIGNGDGSPGGDQSFGNFVISAITPRIPADLDGDGDVDDADFGLAFAAFTGPNNGPSNNPAADLDGDGDVDDADFGLAFAAFTGPGGAASVPEPTSLALIGFGGLLITRRRRA